jgi:signal transduction histidine kinase
MESQNLKIEKKVGDSGYINKNCWLAQNLNYPPARRCQYCELKFRNCLFERYLVISLVLSSSILLVSYLVERNISKALIISIFVLVITYGYFFNKSTEKIIVSNFEEKKSKDAFKELSATLQQKVDDQTKKIREAYEVEKKAKEDLQKLDDMKTEFMLITQHHLRTPLSVMQGYADLVEGGSFGKVPKKIGEVVCKLKESTGGLIKIVNEFLDVSQFQLGKEVVVPQPNVNVEKIVDNVASQLKIQADEKGIYLKVEKSEQKIPLIMADQSKLEVALVNIIDNAIKYTKEGGIAINIKQNDNGKLQIIIKDTGIGIKKENLNVIFSHFLQRSEEAKKSNITGKGIGLYLSSKIIEAHKGKIWAESEGEGKGSTFYIELPLG